MTIQVEMKTILLMSLLLLVILAMVVAGYWNVEANKANAKLIAIDQNKLQLEHDQNLSMQVQASILQGFWKQYSDTNAITVPFPNDKNSLTSVAFVPQFQLTQCVTAYNNLVKELTDKNLLVKQ